MWALETSLYIPTQRWIISAAVGVSHAFSLPGTEQLRRTWRRNRFCIRLSWIFHAERKTKYEDGRGIWHVISNTCIGFIDISSGLNKQFQIWECGTAVTHVLGKADKLLAKPFQHREKVHKQHLNHRPQSLSPAAGCQVSLTGSKCCSHNQQQENGLHSSVYKSAGLKQGFQ